MSDERVANIYKSQVRVQYRAVISCANSRECPFLGYRFIASGSRIVLDKCGGSRGG